MWGEATANGFNDEEVDGQDFPKAPCSNCRPLIATNLHAALVHRVRLRRVIANPDRFGLIIEEARHIRYCLLPVYQSMLKLYLSGLSIQYVVFIVNSSVVSSLTFLQVWMFPNSHENTRLFPLSYGCPFSAVFQLVPIYFPCVQLPSCLS